MSLDQLQRKIGDRSAQIGVIGLGYVGLPLALEFSKAGFRVVGFELDREKVARLEAGESYIEDVPAPELAAAVSEGRLRATVDFDELRECDIVNVCVPTPLTKAKDPDVSHMAKALDVIRLLAERGADIAFHDPFVPEVVVEERSYKGTDLTDAALEGADLVIILTHHSGADYARVVDRAKRVFDTRNATRGIADPGGKLRKL